jgi:hypothetical protein
MKIRKEHLDRAEQNGALPPGGASTLWGDLSQQLAEEPSFKFQHLLYYMGAMLMLLPLSLFVTPGLLKLGDVGLVVLALVIGGGAFLLAEKLLGMGRRIAAGTFSVVSLAMVPLGAYYVLTLCGVDLTAHGSETYEGFHDFISGKFVIIEIITLVAAAFYLYRQRLPFLMLPVTVIVWYMGMDLARVLLDTDSSIIRGWSIGYGLFMLALAHVVDQRTRHTLSDYSFWLWIFGTLSFWTALSSMDSGSEAGKFGYAVINLGMIICSALVNRRVLVVFGALGLLGYLGHLCYSVFKDTLIFPLVALLAGALLVWLAIRWPRIEKSIVGALKKSAA